MGRKRGMAAQSKIIALGVGFGMIAGAAFGQAPTGLVLGTAAGLLITLTRRGSEHENE